MRIFLNGKLKNNVLIDLKWTQNDKALKKRCCEILWIIKNRQKRLIIPNYLKELEDTNKFRNMILKKNSFRINIEIYSKAVFIWQMNCFC